MPRFRVTFVFPRDQQSVRVTAKGRRGAIRRAVKYLIDEGSKPLSKRFGRKVAVESSQIGQLPEVFVVKLGKKGQVEEISGM